MSFVLTDSIVNTNGMWNLVYKSSVVLFFNFILIILGKISYDFKNVKKKVVFFVPPKDKLNILVRSAPILLILIVVLIFWHAINVDWEKLTKYNEYLYTVIPKNIGIRDFLGSLIHFSLPFLGIVMFFTGGALYFYDNRSLSLLFFITGSYFLILEYAFASRASAIILFSATPFIFISQKKNSKSILIIFISLAFWTYLSVLKVRELQSFGLQNITSNIFLIYSDGLFSGFMYILYNLFDGATIMASSVDITANYPDIYKVLSFLPSFSFIDNFNYYLSLYEYRINDYLPFNAYAELYHFGIIYVLIFLVFLYYSFKLSNSMVSKYGLFGYWISSPLYLFIFASQQYPLRSYFRFVFIFLLFVFLFEKLFSKTVLSNGK